MTTNTQIPVPVGSGTGYIPEGSPAALAMNGSGPTSSSTPSTVNAGALTGTTPMDTSGVPSPYTAPANLNALIASYAPVVTAATNESNTAQAGYNTASQDLITLSKSLEGEGAFTADAEKAAGIPDISKEILELEDQSRQKTIEYNMTPYSLSGQGRGVTTGILRGQEAVKQRQVAIDALLINSSLQAKQGKLALAQSTVERAVKAQFEPIRARIETQKLILEKNYENLSRADKKLADARQTALDLQLKNIDTQEQNKKFVLGLMNTAASNQAPNSVLKSIQEAKTPEEALTLASKYLGDPIDRAYKIAQTAALNAKTAEDKNTKRITDTIANLDINSPTHTLDAIKASSGGKLLTGDQAQPITKAMVALSQVGNLSNLFNKTNTGPIVGLIRSYNPYDKDAQLIKGQIQATLANLARSYGETGVLTDTDIARYASTLGKITNPKDLNQALVGITLKALSSGLAATLESNAAAGRDVSGYGPIYNRFGTEISRIENSLGIADEDVNDYLDNSLGSGTTPKTGNPGINTWLNILYGKK